MGLQNVMAVIRRLTLVSKKQGEHKEINQEAYLDSMSTPKNHLSHAYTCTNPDIHPSDGSGATVLNRNFVLIFM